MANNGNKNYIIEQFTLKDSDIKFLSELITSSFLKDEAAQKEGATIIFTEDTFRIIFDSPSTDRELFVRARYKPSNEIVGFLGSVPRNLRINKKVYKCAIPSWLSVHWEHQRKGLAKAMGEKMLQIAKEKKYDAGFAFHEPEQHGIDTSLAVAKGAGLPLNRILSIKEFIIRVFDAEKVASVVKIKWYEKLFFKLKTRIHTVNNSKIRLFKKDDLEVIYKLIEELSQKSQIAIIHDHNDIKRLLNHPKVICVVHENEEGKIDGFIIAWEFLLAGFKNKILFGWLDTVHTYQLSKKQIIDLANFLCIKARERGWEGLQTPYIPYFDAKPFKKANFIFFQKKLSLDLFNINQIPLPEKIKSFYFDWR